jgi:hypothetical protein
MSETKVAEKAIPNPIGLFGGIGSLVAVSTGLSLPRWTSARERQMEHIAGRAVALIGPRSEAPGTNAIRGDAPEED